jgi:addiction module RelB/DinJ family antitoxin
MAETTTLFRARVPAKRLKRAEKILSGLGLKPSDAFNILLAQIELRQGLPFAVTREAARCLRLRSKARCGTMRLGNTEQKPGEVWFTDLGMVEKSRPVLVLSSLSDASARALMVAAPLTSQIRGGFRSLEKRGRRP